MIQHNNIFICITISCRLGGACIGRSCNQIVSGRRLRYGRALAIIQQQEYLEAVSCAYTKVV